ncbi:LysR family transcriptional regulator [Telmatospirillum siberiense]|uniref:LysR family transcriptional regulator n=1 Tax=Telmatospirillum siberiense TaxID=382514 RepID=A0A2N3PYL5_9PROT|nr:LysR family transcriptional regulator [Telmatospirillum siberiense]PKU25507.1 LysR family transcriptional regulator [Telmatospirillum siberiense]
MITFKQLEAIYWIGRLGGFDAAARQLNTTQSAVSKRVQELETALQVALFERSGRVSRLTEKGVELQAFAGELLDRRDLVVEQMSARTAVVRRFRLGVTELTALTWLPRLVDEIRRSYPRVTLDVEVELSATLRKRLAEDTIDLVIVPEEHDDPRFIIRPLGAVTNDWMCTPGLIDGRREMSLADLSRYPLLTQGEASGTGKFYMGWLRANGLGPEHVISSDNLIAQIGLTVSGLGISYLPRGCLGHLVERGVLQVVKTVPSLPPVAYVSLYRSDRVRGINREISQMTEICCDFSALLFQQ